MFGLLWLRVRRDVIIGFVIHNNNTTTTTLSVNDHKQNQKDYSEEFRDIGGVKGKGKAQLPEGAITLINQRIVTDDLPVIFIQTQNTSNHPQSQSGKQNRSFQGPLSDICFFN